jgi:outer membrane protein
MNRVSKLAVISMACWACAAAFGQEKNMILKTGPAFIGFDTNTSLNVGGAPVPGANARAKDNVALGLELVYLLNPNWGVSMTLGTPPTTTLVGKGGPVDGLTLGKVTYGPAVLAMNYRFNSVGKVTPYIGAGVNYTAVLSDKDGAVANLKVKSAWGTVLQAGFEVPVNNDWGVFFDVKKVFLKTTATGTVPAFGGAPASAKIRLDPTIVQLGVSYRF